MRRRPESTEQGAIQAKLSQQSHQIGRNQARTRVTGMLEA